MNKDTEQELYFREDDKLELWTYAQNIKRIIEVCDELPRSNDNESYVIGIDSPWGTGKTHFVKMLKNYLLGYYSKLNASEQSKTATPNKVSSVIYYDAWKNDFWNNAFEPLFDQMIQAAPIKEETEKTDVKNILKIIPRILQIGARGFIVKLADEYIDSDAIKDMGEACKEGFNIAHSDTAQTEQFFPEYSQFRDAIASLRTVLSNSVKKNKKIVIIIDELDRCKPTFAVQTLEIVKHLFNVEGLVFIFSLDIHQLSHCIKLVYGTDFDAVGYLERFFNYLSLLPRSESKKVINSFLNEFGMKEKQNVIDAFSTIIYQYGLSLREARTVLSAFQVLERTSLKEYNDIDDAKVLYFYFLCMKYKMPAIFSTTVFQSKTNEAIEVLKNNSIPLNYHDYPERNVFNLLKENPQIFKGELTHISNHNTKSGIIQIDNIRLSIDNKKILYSVDGCYVIEFKSNDSFSYLLYYPDLLEYDNNKEMRIWEYIYRKLELCDFVPTEL